jgi:hypothetical protein
MAVTLGGVAVMPLVDTVLAQGTVGSPKKHQLFEKLKHVYSIFLSGVSKIPTLLAVPW